MASFPPFFSKLLKIEGTAFTQTRFDKGGATKFGVTLNTWITYGHDVNGDGKITANDVKLLTLNDAKTIAKKVYWDAFGADYIQNQSLAELIVDWSYHSGVGYVKGVLKKLLGSVSSALINKANPSKLFAALKQARKTMLEKIVAKNPTQAKFFKGWMNRLSTLNYMPDSGTSLGIVGIGIVGALAYYYRKPIENQFQRILKS